MNFTHSKVDTQGHFVILDERLWINSLAVVKMKDLGNDQVRLYYSNDADDYTQHSVRPTELLLAIVAAQKQ